MSFTKPSVSNPRWTRFARERLHNKAQRPRYCHLDRAHGDARVEKSAALMLEGAASTASRGALPKINFRQDGQHSWAGGTNRVVGSRSRIVGLPVSHAYCRVEDDLFEQRERHLEISQTIFRIYGKE